MRKTMFSLGLAATALAAPTLARAEVYGGAGFGISYGGIGANIEGQVGRNLGLTAGLGHTIFAGLGWCVGARGYLRSPDRGTRPRLSVLYGSAYITDDFSGDQKAGLTLGVGARSMFGKNRKHGLEYDVLVTVAPSTSSVEKDWGADAAGVPVKIAIGYTLRF
jgi:opacity protein-like surface antigen